MNRADRRERETVPKLSEGCSGDQGYSTVVSVWLRFHIPNQELWV